MNLTLEQFNQRLLELDHQLMGVLARADPEEIERLKDEQQALRKALKAFLKSERERGKTYGTWSSKEWIPNRRPPI